MGTGWRIGRSSDGKRYHRRRTENALESTTASTINMTANITLTEFVTAGATHTLSIAKDKTLTCTGEGGIGLSYNDNISLTIQGGENSKLVCGETTNRSTITNGTPLH